MIVLHDLALAMNHADRVLVLREGRLIADGPPEQALSAQTIANGWGVETEWVGPNGRRALLIPNDRRCAERFAEEKRHSMEMPMVQGTHGVPLFEGPR